MSGCARIVGSALAALSAPRSATGGQALPPTAVAFRYGLFMGLSIRFPGRWTPGGFFVQRSGVLGGWLRRPPECAFPEGRIFVDSRATYSLEV